METGNAKPVWACSEPAVNSYVWLAPPEPVSFRGPLELRIVSTAFYQVFVGDQLHSWGPWRGTRNLLFLTRHFVESDSPARLAFLAYHSGVPSAQQDFVMPWIMVQGVDDAGREVLRTDFRWLVTEDNAWKKRVPASWYLRGFAEVYRADSPGLHPRVPSFQNCGTAQEMPAPVFDPVRIEVQADSPPLGEVIRPLRYRTTGLAGVTRVSPETAAACHRSTWERWCSSLGVWTPLGLKGLGPEKVEYVPVDGRSVVFRPETEWRDGAVLTHGSGGEADDLCEAILFDFGRQYSGLFQVRAKCSSEMTIDILFGDALFRDAGDSQVEGLHARWEDCCALEVPCGETMWTRFHGQSMQYAMLVVSPASCLEEIEFSLRSTALPLSEPQRLKEDKSLLGQGMRVARRTLEIGYSDGFFDCPTRERAQWIGDAVLNGQVIADLFDEVAPLRRLIHSLASESRDGELLKSVVPSAFVDRVPIFDMLVMEKTVWYAERYEPEAEWLLPFLKQRVNAFLPFVTPDGLLQRMPGRHFQEWTVDVARPPVGCPAPEEAEVGRSRPGTVPYDFAAPRTMGINATTNANWVRALSAVGRAAAAGDELYSRRILDLEKKARESFRKLFYDSENGLVTERIPTLDPAEFPPSELPCYAALSASLLSPEDAVGTIELCTDPHYKMIRVGSPLGARYVVEGLLNYGLADEARRYVELAFGPMIREGKTLWEHFRGGSCCHAWGSYPLYLAWVGEPRL